MSALHATGPLANANVQKRPWPFMDDPDCGSEVREPQFPIPTDPRADDRIQYSESLYGIDYNISVGADPNSIPLGIDLNILPIAVECDIPVTGIGSSIPLETDPDIPIGADSNAPLLGVDFNISPVGAGFNTPVGADFNISSLGHDSNIPVEAAWDIPVTNEPEHSLAHTGNLNTALTYVSNAGLVDGLQAAAQYRETCFGTITGVKVRLRLSPNTAPIDQPLCWLEVCPYGAYYGLQLKGTVYAVLNKKTCREVHALLSSVELRLQAQLRHSDWMSVWQRDEMPAVMTLDINVYGFRKDAKKIGSILTSFGTCLQQPTSGLKEVIYYNPHFLHVREVMGEAVLETQLIPLGQVDGETIAPEAANEGRLDAATELTCILNSLAHHDVLQKHDVDRRIRSSLLDHQKEAIDFIFRREIGTLPSELTLWKQSEDDTGEQMYQHLISGTRRALPEEAKGGILADEMGLGKSVVMISTIAGSLQRALASESESPTAGDDARNRKQSRATLVLVPSSLLIDSWMEEIRKYDTPTRPIGIRTEFKIRVCISDLVRHSYPGALSVRKYHGNRRQDSFDQLVSSDIVLTTYATVTMELGRGTSALSDVRWFRIILDEAHDIRNRGTKQFRAVSNLACKHRWCLTGTPIQNSLDDLGALVTFLHVPVLETSATFRKFVITQGESKPSDRFRNLRILLGAICLRRTKELLGLPDPVPRVCEVELTTSERREYNELQDQCRGYIDVAVHGKGKKLKSTILESLLSLRLFCNNGRQRLIPKSSSTAVDADELLSYLQQNEQASCIVCRGLVYSINAASDTDGGSLLPGCTGGHLVCRTCLQQQQTQSLNLQCQHCLAEENDVAGPGPLPIGKLPHLSSENPGSNKNENPQRFPSKLLQFLKDIKEQSSHKSIVFSSWRKTLELVGRLLSGQAMRYYCIHGSVPLAERVRILDAFRSPLGTNILLMTLGTGAVGLNLAVASHIYLLEPQWNPSIELQAIGRSLRLGQKERVTIVRYIVKDTIEDSNVLSHQANKLQLAGGGFDNHRPGALLDKFRALFETPGRISAQQT